MSKREGVTKNWTPKECKQEILAIINRANNEDSNENFFTSIIGMKLRQRRLELKLTQTKVGKMLDVTFQQVQKYETGKNAIGLKNLWKFCVLTDTSIDWFFEKFHMNQLKSIKPTQTIEKERI